MSGAVLVYGATGRTGEQVCNALVADKLPVLAVGRNAAKVASLVGALGSGVEGAAAGIEDARKLRELVVRSSLVLNCAGPFSRCGKPLQDASLDVGRHCLDMSGEPHVVRATLARDEDAKKRGVLLVSGVGFDVVPTDSLAAVLAEKASAPVQSVRVAYSRLDAAPTDGLGLTMLQGLVDGGLAFEDGAWKREELGQHAWMVRFPPPLGPVLCASAPWGDLASLPRSTGAGTVRAYLPRPFVSPVIATAMLRTLRRVLSARSFDRLCTAVARDLARGLPTATDSLSAVVEISGRAGAMTGWLTATPGLAAHAAATCARLAQAPDFRMRGAHTPATAFGARRLLAELGGRGLRWGTFDAHADAHA